MSAKISREFTVAVFVVHGDRVLLHFHQKLGRWLPPGGHIEPNELPDDAAVREVFEETGVRITLWGTPRIAIYDSEQPRQLCPPAGIQLARIREGHEHIDLVYFATGEPADDRPGVGWFSCQEWSALDLTDEVATWCREALETIGTRQSV